MTAADAHGRATELLGAFVLHAVEPDEATMVEEHLARCQRCQQEVDQLLEVAAAIGNVSEPPPGGLWDQIAARLPAATPDPSADAGADVSGAAGGPARRRDRVRRPASRRVWATVGIGAAAACIALAAIFAVGWSTAEGRVGQLQAALAHRGSAGAVQAALASRDHRLVELRADDGGQLAELVVQRNGTGYVVTSRMSPLPGDETYQLWAKIAGQPISIGLLGPDPDTGDAFALGTSVAIASELLVTVEPSGGVVAPDRAPVAMGTFS